MTGLRLTTASSGGVTTLTGTANQVDVSASTGAVTVSLDPAIIQPGSIEIAGTGGAGYVQLDTQSSNPTAPPANSLRLSSGPTGNFIVKGSSGFAAQLATSGLTVSRTFTFPDLVGTFALTTNNLSVFASTTSAQLAGVISDETGSGSLVFGTAPTLTNISLDLLTMTGNGAASIAPLTKTGTVFTGGSGTTTFPYELFQPTGTTAVTSWSTSGTGLGMNLASGFAGNFLDFHAAGAASVFTVTSIGAISAASLNVTGATAPTNGLYFAGGAALAIATAGSQRFQFTSVGMFSPVTGGVQISTSAASATVPNVIPVRGDTTTGIGAQASGNISMIVGAAEITRFVTGGLTIISGKALTLGNAASTGLAAGVLAATTNATIVITDSTGQAYRIPCIV